MGGRAEEGNAVSDSPWTSPSGQDPAAASPPPGPVPPYYPSPAPGYGGPPPGYAPPPPGYAPPPPGWTPPPRPGLIPLAPMGLGAILGASFRVLRRNPRPVVGISLIIHAILALISIAVTALLTANALGRYFDALDSISSSGQLSKTSLVSAGSSLVIASATTLVSAIFTYAGQTILQGIITMEVSRGTLGEKLPLSALWARSRGRIGALLGWAGLVILVSFLVFGIVVGGLVLLFAFGGSAGIVVGIILAILFVLGGIVVGVWLWTKLSLVPSAIIIERLPLRGAVRRSWNLTRGYFWRTFGIEILVALIVGAAGSIIETPVTLIVEVLSLLGNPTGVAHSGAAVASVFGVTQIAGTITMAVVETITAVISTAATALIYIDLRIRKEGLDLALMRYVDARAAGATDVSDPFIAQPVAVPTTSPAAADAAQGA